MKNFEAYENKIKALKGEIALNQNNELISCIGFHCRDCKFNVKGNHCIQNLLNWLYEEYEKPKFEIPLATKAILENLDGRCRWIAKDENGIVFVYANKPEKHNIGWEGNSMLCLNTFNSELFSFLSWEDEEPTNIKELLENCEVIEDE